MMDVSTFLALIVFLFPLAYSPGPGNTFFAALGASGGLRSAVPALIGYHAATFVVTAAIGLGLGLTVLSEPLFAKALSAIGSLYVLWIGIQFFRSARSQSDGESDDVQAPAKRVGFVGGAIVLLFNPKAYVIIGLLFTQFLRVEDEKVWNVLAITTVFTTNNLVAFIVWVIAGAALTRLIRGSNARTYIDYIFSVTLVGVAVWMAIPLFTSAH